MTDTLTDTYNRDDILRVYASFAADYRIVAEWTKLHSSATVEKAIEQIQAIAEAEYLKTVHLRLMASADTVREAAVYRVSTNAAGWSADRPGDLYWDTEQGDYLEVLVYYTPKWYALDADQRAAFRAIHMPNWGTTDFDENYGALATSTDRQYSSGGYGLERTRVSG